MDTRKLTGREFALLEQVLGILLAGKESCLHTWDDRFVMALVDSPQHVAVERLIAEFGSSEVLANIAACAYLDRFDRGPQGLFRDTGALEYSCRIANRFHVSSGVAERLVGCVARAGWHGRLEGLAKTLCKRAPRAEEVILLFDNYAGGAVDSTSTEERLLAYAAKYLSPDAARTQLARIDEHHRNHQFD